MHVQPKHMGRAVVGVLLATLAACGDPTTLAQPDLAARRVTLSGVTRTVRNLNDAGEGSLREAVATAGAGDLINFSLATSDTTIVLASPLYINQSLVIDAPANGITIRANYLYRAVIYVGGMTPNAGVMMKRVRVTGGSNGGIIAAGGSALALEDCIIEGNGGGGVNVYNSSLALLRTVVRNNISSADGGGVRIIGGASSTITNSTISGNTSEGFGGGIFANGDVTFIASTISGNTARMGGGIASSNVVVIRNSTLSNNSAEYGSNLFNGSLMSVDHTTIVGNSSGSSVQLDSYITMRNSILSSTASNCGMGASIQYEGANIVSDNSCPTLGTPPIIGNAWLAPLALDGLTAVHHLLSGSPAINAVPTCLVTVDQRGAPRPQGPGCDLGSIEEPVPLLVTPTSAAAGTINSKTGVVLINGKVTCSVDGAVTFNAALEQTQKSGRVTFVLTASTPVQATCVGGSALWSAFTIPASGAFANGSAIVKLAVSSAGGVTPFNSSTAIRLNWAK